LESIAAAALLERNHASPLHQTGLHSFSSNTSSSEDENMNIDPNLLSPILETFAFESEAFGLVCVPFLDSHFLDFDLFCHNKSIYFV
jgi:hypothetical protein